MMVAMAFGLGLTILLGKPFIRRLQALKIGHTIRIADVSALAGTYDKSKAIPSMGGLLFISTVCLTCFWMDWHSLYTKILFITMVWMGMIGFLDDYLKLQGKGISARVKFGLQALFALGFGLYLFPWYYVPFILFVITGSTNAVNLTDGLDGLAAGLSLLVAAVLAVIAFVSNHQILAEYLHTPYIEGSGEIAVFLCALIGALLGFLWFNGYPAQVFMGDTGSLAIGGVLGVSAVLLQREFLYALVAGMFVIETLSVIIQVLSFRYRKKRVFLCAPIHHHFQMKGWHEMKVVTRFWMMGLLFAFIEMVQLEKFLDF